MEDLKDIRRQLKENPQSRELNNRYAQACLDSRERIYRYVPGAYLYLVRPLIWKPCSTLSPRFLMLRF